MAEQPPLNRIYVFGYSANDRDFPIVSLTADPRVAGYQVPKDLSACPDKRYPNHVFTGAQPISGDQRVRHVWEILPSPYVPFTRYDDDLGPVQGRRRSVKNEGQVASRESNKQVTYEAREGSAIVYTELEETWSIRTDEDGNSLFPIRDRDFYDASRGPVQERRQLFVPTGEEEGSLENVNGVITQTSYEPYNDFLSVKIVQTYKVDGPQLIGKTTDNDGQLVTVTTQRKGSKDYVPPNPSATKTVEVNREDAESLVERIVEAPEVFKANTFSIERPDSIPQKFRVAVPSQTSQEIVEGAAEPPVLLTGELSRTEEQRNKFIKRVSATSRDQTVLPKTLIQKSTNNERQEVTITETLQLGDTNEAPSAIKTVESEALGDGNYVIRKTEVDNVFGAETYQKTKADLTPQKFRATQEDTTLEQTVAGIADPNITLPTGVFSKSEQQVNRFVKRVSTTSRSITEAVVLNEKILTQEGQVATRTLRLASGDQTFDPSALLIDANVEALGDGRTVKTETFVPEVFSAETKSIERPDNIPQKFRATIPTKTSETTQEGTVVDPTLNSGDLSKSEQQVTKFVKRIRSTQREVPLTTVELQGTTFTSDLGGGYATVTETYPFNGIIETPSFGTISDEVENLGDGTKIRRKVSLQSQDYTLPDFSEDGDPITTETLAPLTGQDYDAELDFVIPYRQLVVKPSGQLASGSRRRVVPRDVAHSIVTQYELDDIQESLENYYMEVPDMIEVSLPDKLLSVSLASSFSSGSGSSSGFGNTYSISNSIRGSASGQLTYDIEQGFRGVVPAKRAIFFLESQNTSPSAVLSKISQKSQIPNLEFWPNARPQSHQLVITSGGGYQETQESVSFDSGSSSESSGQELNSSVSSIPATIHGPISIGSTSVSTSIVKVDPLNLPPTEPYSEFPTGFFLYRINASPYRFSYARIDAIIVEITSDYV